MTEQEALLQIQAIPQKIWVQLSEAEDEAMEIAFKSLEKQIAKKVTAVKPYGHKCACGNYFDNRAWHSRYCGLCGQRLDWGNEDDRD